ncbi:hypothetical protein AWB71_05240 [Caballeronia peredens]|nr:hypothetical protein AWB71_05240 [Caballeronia peredens]
MNNELTYEDLLNKAKASAKNLIAFGDIDSDTDLTEAAYDIAVDVTPVYMADLCAVLANDCWIPVSANCDDGCYGGFIRLIQESIANELSRDVEEYLTERLESVEDSEEEDEETEE